MDGFDERYEAVPDSVPRARASVADLAAAAGAGERLLADVRLAVSEAVTNAVLHGYRGSTGEVHVSARVDTAGLTVIVRDAGAGSETKAQRPGMGLGLGLIAELADEVVVDPAPTGGTVLRMRFALARQPELAAAA